MDESERHLFWGGRFKKIELDIATFPYIQQISMLLEAVASLGDVRELSACRILQPFRIFPQVEVYLY